MVSGRHGLIQYQGEFLTAALLSSHMHVMNHNWPVRKLYLQSAAGISHRSQLCQRTGFNNVGHHLSLAARTQISVCKSPFPSAGSALSLFCAKMVK